MAASKPPPNTKSQTTLFQNWGYYGKQIQQTTSSDQEEPIVIEDDLDEVDEAALLAACEQAELTDRQPLSDPSLIPDVPEATPLESLPGFDVSAGRLWIYPTNYPVRDYQFNIVGQALKKNTLVTLPTGLGKTFIAAVVMYNYYRWYPQGKVVFMAPTKPLVAQQIEACFNIMGIPESDMAEMTGSMPPAERKKIWRAKRIFFLTPQVLTNDLSRQACPAVEVKCLVVDEAHKALGNHAYCEVVRELSKYTPNFRVLALSATPGGDLKAVQQVINNLLISHVEIRSEESIDIQPYAHERKVEKVVVPLGEELRHLQKQYLEMLRVYVKRLASARAVLDKDPALFSKFQLLKAREAFRQDPPPQVQNKGAVEGDFAISLSLYHGYELLMQHGTRTLFNFLSNTVDGEKGFSRTRQELMRNGTFINMMNVLREKFDYGENGGNMSLLGSPSSTSPSRPISCTQKSKKFVVSHPKMQRLQEIVIQHFKNYKNNFRAQPSTSEADSTTSNDDTRVMIFAQYRDSVQEIAEMLNCHQPLVRCMSFVGQSSAGKATKGISQKEQLRVVKEFRCGNYNTLVSTCVGEEGLDIGDVDLIVCYDAHKSPTRLVQRMGRTGRKRSGRIVMLMTEGKEASVYDKSQYSRRGIHKALQGNSKSLQLFPSSPQMIPRGLDPQPHKMYITSEQYIGKQKKRKGGKKTADGPITRLLKNDKKVSKSRSAFLTEEEHSNWVANFQVEGPVPTLPHRGSFFSLGDSRKVPESPELSLSSWSLWQCKEQKTHLIGHSKRTRDFVQLMEFMEIQDQTDGEDIYGREMALYLNERDVMIPKSDKGIRKFCKKKDKGRKGKSSEGDKEEAEGELVEKKRKKREPLPVLVSDDSEDDFLDRSGCTLPEVQLHGEKDRADNPDKNQITKVAVAQEQHQEIGTRESRSKEGRASKEGQVLSDVAADSVQPFETRTGLIGGQFNSHQDKTEDIARDGEVICGPRTEPKSCEDESQLLAGKTGDRVTISNQEVDICVTSDKASESVGHEEPTIVEGALVRKEKSIGTEHNLNTIDDIPVLQNIDSTASSESDDMNSKQRQKLKKKKKNKKEEVFDDAFEETSMMKKTSTSPTSHKLLDDLVEPSISPDTKKPSEVLEKKDKSPKHINDLLKLLKSHRKDSMVDIEEGERADSNGHHTAESSVVDLVGASNEEVVGMEEDLSCLFPCSQFSFSMKPTIRGRFDGQLVPSPPSVSSLDILDDIELSFGTPGREATSNVDEDSALRKDLAIQHSGWSYSIDCPANEIDGKRDALVKETALQYQDTEQAVVQSDSTLRDCMNKSAGKHPSENSSVEKAKENGNTSGQKNSVQDISTLQSSNKKTPIVSDGIPVNGGNHNVSNKVISSAAHTGCHEELVNTHSETKAESECTSGTHTRNTLQLEGKNSDSLCIDDLEGFDDWNDTSDVPDLFDAETPTSAKLVCNKTGHKLSVSKFSVLLGESMSFSNMPNLKKCVLGNPGESTMANTLSCDKMDTGREKDSMMSSSNSLLLSERVVRNERDKIRHQEESTSVHKQPFAGSSSVLSDIRHNLCDKSSVQVNFDLNFDLGSLDDDDGGDDDVSRSCNPEITCTMRQTSPHLGASYHVVESPALNQPLHQPKAESTPLTHRTAMQMPTKLALTPLSTFQSKSRRKWQQAGPKPNGVSKIRMETTGTSQSANHLSKQGDLSVTDDTGGAVSPMHVVKESSLLKKLSFSNVSSISEDSKKRTSTASSPEQPIAKRRRWSDLNSSGTSSLMGTKHGGLDGSRNKRSFVSLPKSDDTPVPVLGNSQEPIPDSKVVESMLGVSERRNGKDGIDHSSQEEFSLRHSKLVDVPEASSETTLNSEGCLIKTLEHSSLPEAEDEGKSNKINRIGTIEREMNGKNGINFSEDSNQQEQSSRKTRIFNSSVNDSNKKLEVELASEVINKNVVVPRVVSPCESEWKSQKPLRPEPPGPSAVKDEICLPVTVGIGRSRQESLNSPELIRPKRKPRLLDSPVTSSGDDMVYVGSEDDVEGNGSTQEFEICEPIKTAQDRRVTSPTVIVSDDEVLSQIPKAKKRCRNVLRSPEDSSPTPRPDGKMLKKRKSKKVLQSSSDEDEVTPVKPPASRKRRCLISPPSMIPDLDSDFEDTTPRKPRQLTRNPEFAQPSSKKSLRKAASKRTSKVRRGAMDFLDEEAELSCEEGVSSDEEGSMLDHSLEGFINNATQPSQHSPSGVNDMHAVYMKSIRSPAGNAILHPGRNRFKMSHATVNNDNIFSQVPHPEESYTEDSFCVEGDDRSTVNPAEVSHGDLENTINVDNIIGGTGCKRLRNRRGGESKAERILRLGRKAVLKSDSTDEESENDEVIWDTKSRMNGQRSSLRTTASSSSVNGRAVSNAKSHHLRARGQQFQNKGQMGRSHFQRKGHLQDKGQGFHSEGQFQSKAHQSKACLLKEKCQTSSTCHRLRTSRPTVEVDAIPNDRVELNMLKTSAKENGSKMGGDAQDKRPQDEFGGVGLNFDLGFEEDSLSNTEEPVEEDPSRLFQNSAREQLALTKEQRDREERLRKQKEKQEEFRKKMAAKRKATEGGESGQESQGFNIANDRGSASSDVSSMKVAIPATQFSQDLMGRSKKPVILISSRVLSSSPSLVSTLAIKHSMDPRVCQLKGCDFMVSSRMGVERKTLSEFALSSNKTKFVERIKEMGTLFDKICVIIEKDRLKKDEKPKAFTRSKYFDSTIAALTRSSVKILFSDSIDDTSLILAELAKVEARKGFCILYPKELSGTQEQVQSFCLSIPGVSFALSLSMTIRFASLSQLVTCSEKMLQQQTDISEERARRILGHFKHQFDEQMMGTPKRR